MLVELGLRSLAVRQTGNKRAITMSNNSDLQVTVVDHPLIQHKLSLMRDVETSTSSFRRLMREVSLLLCYEITRDLPLQEVDVQTPVAATKSPVLAEKLCFVSILRAGNGLLEGMLDLIPVARVGHVGLYRDPETLMAVEYYYKVPQDISERQVIVVDPMLATANSAIAAVDRLKRGGASKIKFVSLLSAPEGVRAFNEAHPDVALHTASLDSHLNEHGYIVPGLGDAGDRIYGTQ